MTVQDQTTTQGIILTDAAAVKVSSLLEQEGRDDLRLRIAVQPGGCSGLRTIEKQGFTIDNPNATGSCACGDSFH